VKVLLATGLSQIEQQMESRDWNRCYQRQILLDVVKEHGSQVVVLSPLLQGEEDLLKEIIIPLRTEGIRIIFLPGNAKMPDTKEWMKKLLPWGVYDYVFDPVTTEKIIDRINNPAQLKNLPSEVQMSSQEAQAVGNIVPDDQSEHQSKLYELNILGTMTEAIGNIKNLLPRIFTKSQNSVFNTESEGFSNAIKIPEVQLPRIPQIAMSSSTRNLSKERRETLGLSEEPSPGIGAIIISLVLVLGIICLTIVLVKNYFPQIVNYINF